MRRTHWIVTGALAATAAAALALPNIASAAPAPVVTRAAAVAPSFSQTLCQGGVNDEQVLTWWAPVTAGQPVVATAVEAASPNGTEFIGAAHVYAESVAVSDNQVQVRVHTGWGAPLNICLHYVG